MTAWLATHPVQHHQVKKRGAEGAGEGEGVALEVCADEDVATELCDPFEDCDHAEEALGVAGYTELDDEEGGLLLETTAFEAHRFAMLPLLSLVT